MVTAAVLGKREESYLPRNNSIPLRTWTPITLVPASETEEAVVPSCQLRGWHLHIGSHSSAAWCQVQKKWQSSDQIAMLWGLLIKPHPGPL